MFTKNRRLQDVRERDKACRLWSFFKREFAQSLDVETIFVIARSAANFNEHDIDLVAVVARHGQLTQAHLHQTSDVRNHLHIAAEIAAATFAFEHLGVHLSRGNEILARELLAENALVGAQIHVGFASIGEHKHFAMAIGIERARIDVEIALHLDGRDRQTFIFDEFRERAGKDSFAEAAHHRADDHHKFGLATEVSRRSGRMPLRALFTLSKLGEKPRAFWLISGRGFRVGHSRM